MTIKKIYNRLGWVTGIDAGEGIMMRTLHYADAVPGFTPCFNGNISVMDWSTGSGAQKMINRYRYTYDNLNCIIATDYETLGQSNTNNENFSTYYTYDLNCIITTLRRYGKSEEYTLGQRTFTNFGLIDDLSMTYNGNQLKKVSDQADELTYAGSMDFKDGANKATEYTWDANGNMTKDQNKGLTSISYNRLNLPARIVFQDGHVNYNTYSYDGRKLATTYKIRNVNTVDPGTPFPIFPNGDGDDLNADILNGRGLNDSITVGQDTIITWDPETTLYTRYYSDNYIHRGNSVERILTPNGFMASDTLYAYIKDHQGNVSAVIDQTGRVVEVNHYYPYGMLMTMLSMANEIPPNDYQPYKYGTKELNRENGLDLYDSYARWYDPALPGTTGQDPKAEDYTPISPYAWCAANPIRNIDFSGDTIAYIEGETYTYRECSGVFGFYDKGNNLYKGKATFVNDLTNALDKIRSGTFGNYLVSNLMSSEYTIQIVCAKKDQKNKYDPNLRGIVWGPTIMDGGMDVNGHLQRDAYIGLAHELAHGFGDINDLLIDGTWFVNQDSQESISNAEKFATFYENLIRREHQVPLRKYYLNSRDDYNLFDSIILNSSNENLYYKEDFIGNKLNITRLK